MRGGLGVGGREKGALEDTGDEHYEGYVEGEAGGGLGTVDGEDLVGVAGYRARCDTVAWLAPLWSRLVPSHDPLKGEPTISALSS